jgi:hypothetical protein
MNFVALRMLTGDRARYFGLAERAFRREERRRFRRANDWNRGARAHRRSSFRRTAGENAQSGN